MKVGKTYKAGDVWKEEKDTILYAIWSATQYEVIFNPNGGQVTPASKPVIYNGEYESLPTPTKEGYIFKGWFTEEGAQIKSDTKFIGLEDQTIYAHWEAKTYTITYNVNGGTGSIASQTKKHDETLTLSSVKPTSKYATFLGWSTNSAATSATYAAGAGYTANGNATLYAVWQKYPDLVLYNKGTFSKAATANHAYSGTIYAVTYNSDHIQFGYREIRNLFFNDAISNKYRYLKVIAKTNRNSSAGTWYNSVFFVSSDKTHSGYIPSKIIKKYEILNSSSTTDYTTWKEFTLDLQSVTNTSFYVGIWNCDTDLYIQKVWLSN